MEITIEIDDKTIEQIDLAAKDFNKNRLQYISESLQKSVRRDLKRKANLTDEDVAEIYEEAYGKFPVQPDEFEIEDEQTEVFWDRI